MTNDVTLDEGLDGAAAQGQIDAESAFRRKMPVVPEWKVAKAAQMLGEAWSGSRRAVRDLEEVFTSNDFQTAAAIVLDREALAVYQGIQSSWTQWVPQTTVRDFRPKLLSDFTQSGFDLLPVAELAPYREAERAGGKQFQISVSKYGRLYGFSWEAGINDQLDELQDLPAAFADAAAKLDAKNAISLLTKGNGPDTGYFKNYTTGPFTGVNTTPKTVPLTMANLDAALQDLRGRIPVDKDRPVIVPSYKLIVPPALQTQAERILATVVVTDVDATTQQRVEHTNYVAGSVNLQVEPWLPIVDKGAKAATTWYLIPDPASTVKPFMFARLRGHEGPELRIKTDTGRLVGGGEVDPLEGNFDNDAVMYRLRAVNGVAQLDPTFTYVSVGS